MSTARYAPPPERFGLRALLMALVAHGFLLAALTWGTSWRSANEITTASAELWAELPTQAAPPLIVQPVLPEKPIPEPISDPVAIKTPDIVAKKAKPKREPKPEQKPEQKSKPDRKAKEVDTAHQRELLRQNQIERMKELAGTGASAGSGTALRNAGSSASYGGKVEAAIRPNIVFTEVESIQGNPAAEVAIRMAPDGTIVGVPQLLKSSGHKAWDAAVLRAIDKTERLPRDTDGRVPSTLTLILRPKR